MKLLVVTTQDFRGLQFSLGASTLSRDENQSKQKESEDEDVVKRINHKKFI
jgi:hypothetical protein